MKFPFLFGADEGKGGAGSGSSAEPLQRPSATDVLGRYSGDAIRMAEKIAALEHDNYQAREKLRDLRASLESARKQAPPEGAAVLTAEEAQAFEAYRAFGQPDELKTALETGEAAIAERDALRQAAILEQAAKAENFRPGVLKILGKGLEIEMKEIEVPTEDGSFTKQSVPVVVARDGDTTTETPLRKYFEAQGEDVLGSLEASGPGGQNPAHSGTSHGGTPYPPQSAGAGHRAGYKPVNRYAHNMKKSE